MSAVEHQSTASAEIAEMIRARLRRPPPPLPRADGALMLVAALIVVLTALATLAILSVPHLLAEDAEGPMPSRVGDVSLVVPRDLTGPDAEGGRLVGMTRLRLAWPDMAPVGPTTRHRLLVTLSPPDKVNEPATQLAVYARFLTPTVWSNPGGLVVRAFRKGSPFEGDELYVSVPDGRGFAARCPSDATARQPLDELCRVTFRHRGMDVNIRFPRAVIADWEVMLGNVRRTVDGMIR